MGVFEYCKVLGFLVGTLQVVPWCLPVVRVTLVVVCRV